MDSLAKPYSVIRAVSHFNIFSQGLIQVLPPDRCLCTGCVLSRVSPHAPQKQIHDTPACCCCVQDSTFLSSFARTTFRHQCSPERPPSPCRHWPLDPASPKSASICSASLIQWGCIIPSHHRHSSFAAVAASPPPLLSLGRPPVWRRGRGQGF